MPSTLKLCACAKDNETIRILPVPVVTVEPGASTPSQTPVIRKAKSKPPKKAATESNGLWLRRKEAITFLGTRSVLEDAERAGWLKAAVRRPRLVLYNRQEVLACAYRLSQGEYPD